MQREQTEHLRQVAQRTQGLEEAQHKALRDAEIGMQCVTLALTISHTALQPPFDPLDLW
jgi:hypothetical protein